jgi:hypothetical protein
MPTIDYRLATGLGHDELRRLCGDIVDWKIAAIEQLHATPEEVEEAVAWAAGEDDVMAAERKPLSGRVAAVYDILTADDEDDVRERGR